MIKTVVRKIGGSMGTIFPKDETKGLGLKEGEEIFIEINRPSPLKELFGSGTLSKPAKELLKEERKNESRHW